MLDSGSTGKNKRREKTAGYWFHKNVEEGIERGDGGAGVQREVRDGERIRKSDSRSV